MCNGTKSIQENLLVSTYFVDLECPHKAASQSCFTKLLHKAASQSCFILTLSLTI